MKTLTTVLFAGAMLASACFATPNDPLAEERFKMKTGRYTPVEEARRQALDKQKTENPQKTETKPDCMEHGCCRGANVAAH